MDDKDLTLPPLLSAMGFGADADLAGESVYRARRGRLDPGTICYSRRPDRLDAVIMLAPETPLIEAIQVIYPLMLAANDALGATLPPGVAVHLAWPDRLMVNGALAGGIALMTETEDPDTVPDWILARLTIDIMGNPADMLPGETKDKTALYEEGAVEVYAPMLLAAYPKYFLNWLDRWQRDGMASVSDPFLDRAAGRGEDAAFPDGTEIVRGQVSKITEDGDLILTMGGKMRQLALSDLLSGASWEL